MEKKKKKINNSSNTKEKKVEMPGDLRRSSGGSSSSSGLTTVFIGKLHSRMREDDLRDEFRRYGRIRDLDFHRHRGFAFIEYYSSSDARAAVDEMDGQRFDDTRIVVQFRGTKHMDR